MECEILLSTMNINTTDEMYEMLYKMNVNNNCLIINQVKDDKNINFENMNIRIISYKEKGLSKSRNRAINNLKGTIGIIADDDIKYVDNYETIISNAYKEHKDCDIIAFYVENAKPKDVLREGNVDFLHTFKLCSVQLTFKSQKVIENNIRFDERFGTGSGIYNAGEENVFLTDCLKRKLKIYYIPIKIGTLISKDSTWFKGYNEEYFISKGAFFYRISKIGYIVLILQFAIRKYRTYSKEITMRKAIKSMFDGAKSLKRKIKNEEK